MKAILTLQKIARKLSLSSKGKTFTSRRVFLLQGFKGMGLFFLTWIFPSKKILAGADQNSKIESNPDDVDFDQTEVKEVLLDCLILGGGLAGLTAANALAFPRRKHADPINTKPRSVLVLEARGRLGGRIDTRYIEGFPGSVEMGAQYIHVDNKKNKKGRRYSLWNALAEYQITTQPLHRLVYGVAFSRYFAKLRSHWQVFLEFPLKWVLGFRAEITNYRGPDMSMRQWLEGRTTGGANQSLGRKPRYTTKQKPLVDIYLSGPASGRLEEMSLRGFNLDRFATIDEGDYEYKVIPGWSYFVEQLKFPLKAFVRDPRVGDKIPIKFNTEVTNVEYGADGVTVTVRERNGGKPGSVHSEAVYREIQYRAKTAIVTFPIGILRRAAGIDPRDPKDLLQFNPSLPSQKIDALRAIGVGVAAKMFIVFESCFWGDKIGLINRVDGLQQMGRTYFVPNFGNPNENVVLGAYFGGAEAHKILHWSETEILEKVCEELAEIFPQAHFEKNILARVKRNKQGDSLLVYKHWAKDRWSYGNDSFLVFDEKDPSLASLIGRARKDLASPEFTGALHWAGEATVYEDGNHQIYAHSHAGVTHGAHTSGLRAAREVAGSLDRLV